ncbi:MAG: MCP four helix bundle domain-containing protein [Acidobacteriia bacterium]|nr:MCP four helix bundle domain-containing protein [Terriglobia bacterium]
MLAGFGGLLLLMALAGIDGIQTLRQIEASSDEVREEFLQRTRVLERIRGDLYVSGTYVRDYLLEPESGKAEGHRYSLLETRRDMDQALNQYRTLLNAQESTPFQVLMRELTSYWRVLEPVFQWTTAERRNDGYFFLRDEVFPRRTSMLAIADQIRSLNEAQLNDGKEKVAQLFARIRWRLILTIGLTIGLGLLLAAFAMRKILFLEARTERAGTELKQLSARLVEAQENERRSISRELHDEIGQALSAVLVELANLSNLVKARNIEAAALKSGEIKRMIENSIGVARNMALLLRPSMLDDLGLVPALQWQAREIGRRDGVWVTVEAENVSENLPEDVKTCVYRVVQEALHNAVRHAAAAKIQVTVLQDADQLRLFVQDDGKGFDAAQQRGMGLLGIQERVSYLGGRFSVESKSGEGTVLGVTLPVAEITSKQETQRV